MLIDWLCLFLVFLLLTFSTMMRPTYARERCEEKERPRRRGGGSACSPTASFQFLEITSQHGHLYGLAIPSTHHPFGIFMQCGSLAIQGKGVSRKWSTPDGGEMDQLMRQVGFSFAEDIALRHAKPGGHTSCSEGPVSWGLQPHLQFGHPLYPTPHTYQPTNAILLPQWSQADTTTPNIEHHTSATTVLYNLQPVESSIA